MLNDQDESENASQDIQLPATAALLALGQCHLADALQCEEEEALQRSCLLRVELKLGWIAIIRLSLMRF